MARGVHFHGERGAGIPTFGPDVTAAFCVREGLQLVVRSHQFVRQGVKFMHSVARAPARTPLALFPTPTLALHRAS
eukprot:1604518-Prymnesium_polylepis.1